jgi:hypothetical protein
MIVVDGEGLEELMDLSEVMCPLKRNPAMKEK